MIEINLTPNRPDCTSVHGIARDLAAAGLGKLKIDTVPQLKATRAAPAQVNLQFDPGDEQLCPLFALRLVRGVRNGPSPEWMQRRLSAIGLRPINALVDITNYVTFDRGRPLHVFDAKKVKGALTVRRARDGETVTALDGRTYTLDDSIVVIADEDGVESIAGIMGGEHSGCDANTTDVLIESALWDPFNIAQSGRKLGIITDARYRFERGVDPLFTVPGLDLATRMVLDLCGGEASQAAVAGVVPEDSRVIDFPWTEVQRLSGLDVPRPESKVILEQLGFHIAGTGRPREGRAAVLASGHRGQGRPRRGGDPHRRRRPHRAEAPAAASWKRVAKPVLTPIQKRTRLAKRTLAARGLVEAVTWSFIAKDEAELFGGGDKRLALANPDRLGPLRHAPEPAAGPPESRRSAMPTAASATSPCSRSASASPPTSRKARRSRRRRCAAARPAREDVGRHWNGGGRAVDAFEAKADALALLASLGVPTGGLQVVAGRPGVVPSRPLRARSSSVPRMLSAPSASCTRRS